MLDDQDGRLHSLSVTNFKVGATSFSYVGTSHGLLTVINRNGSPYLPDLPTETDLTPLHFFVGTNCDFPFSRKLEVI